MLKLSNAKEGQDKMRPPPIVQNCQAEYFFRNQVYQGNKGSEGEGLDGTDDLLQ